MLKNEEDNRQGFYLIQFKKALYWIVIVLSGYLLYYLSLGLWTVIHYIANSGFQLESIITSLVWFPAVIFGWVMVSTVMVYFSPIYFPVIPTLVWEVGWLGGLGAIYYKKKNPPDAKLAVGTLLLFLSAIFFLNFGKEIFSFYTSFLMTWDLDPIFYPAIFDYLGYYWLLPLWLLSWSFFWLKKITQFRSEDKSLFLLWIAWLILLQFFLWMYTIPYLNPSSW
ncbi:MAG: hypothetical protein EAX86_09425 [Candidatus Heimdallarchaeota archaeon]|nr:hypothetical protein [Candidatus Heimdallarchaeota archaeon]